MGKSSTVKLGPKYCVAVLALGIGKLALHALEWHTVITQGMLA